MGRFSYGSRTRDQCRYPSYIRMFTKTIGKRGQIELFRLVGLTQAYITQILFSPCLMYDKDGAICMLLLPAKHGWSCVVSHRSVFERVNESWSLLALNRM